MATLFIVACEDSPHRSRTNRGAVSEEATTVAWLGSDAVVAALVTPLPGTLESPHWYRDLLRRLAVSPNPGSFFSLRVYRVGGTEELSLADLDLSLVTPKGTFRAEDIELRDTTDRPERSVLAGRSLAAMRSRSLPSGEGFEVWFAIADSVEFSQITQATLRVEGRELELAARPLSTESLAAFAAQARSEWIVGNLAERSPGEKPAPPAR